MERWEGSFCSESSRLELEDSPRSAGPNCQKWQIQVVPVSEQRDFLGTHEPSRHRIHVKWYIYLHWSHKFKPNVGKYTIHGSYESRYIAGAICSKSWTWFLRPFFWRIPLLNHHLGWPRLRSLQIAQILPWYCLHLLWKPTKCRYPSAPFDRSESVFWGFKGLFIPPEKVFGALGINM